VPCSTPASLYGDGRRLGGDGAINGKEVEMQAEQVDGPMIGWAILLLES
jgi:hypothetical protein